MVIIIFQGREDDMLKISGQWASPLEIEGVLLEHPAVRDCGVIGMPNTTGLIKVKAFIILNDGYTASADMEKSLIDFVRSKTAHFKAPRWIQFVKELPRTATGKLQRYKLRQKT
jgi:acyl-coenzyme A synthetase/AMP-(fatty) acid ligase